MYDNFTIKMVQMTDKIGEALRSLRISNRITAKDAAHIIDMSPAYITKLERGGLRTIKADVFVKLCNYISNSDQGCEKLLLAITQSNEDLPSETLVSLLNIDDLLIVHYLPESLVKNIAEIMEKHQITEEQMINQINKNELIRAMKGYDNLPTNMWVINQEDNSGEFLIKLSISQDYLHALLTMHVTHVHRVIIEGILFALYKLANKENPRVLALSELKSSNIKRSLSKVITPEEKLDDIFDGIDDETLSSIRTIVDGLKFVAGISGDYGRKGMKSIVANMKSDLGFAYAFFKTPLYRLNSKTKGQKTQFLKDVRELVEKYVSEADEIEVYDDPL